MCYEKLEGLLIGLSAGFLLACILKHRFAEDEAQTTDRSSRRSGVDSTVRRMAAIA
jgi:hypothetical protein